MSLNIETIIVFVSIVASAECEQVPQWQELECEVKYPLRLKKLVYSLFNI